MSDDVATDAIVSNVVVVVVDDVDVNDDDDIVVAELDTSEVSFGQTQFDVEGVAVVTSSATAAAPSPMSLLLLTCDAEEVGE